MAWRKMKSYKRWLYWKRLRKYTPEKCKNSETPENYTLIKNMRQLRKPETLENFTLRNKIHSGIPEKGKYSEKDREEEKSLT